MSIFKNPESCPNCVHKDVCMYKKDYAKFVADLEKDDRLLPAGVDFIEPLVVTCKYFYQPVSARLAQIEKKPIIHEYD